jgi:hypothetical protein
LISLRTNKWCVTWLSKWLFLVVVRSKLRGTPWTRILRSASSAGPRPCLELTLRRFFFNCVLIFDICVVMTHASNYYWSHFWSPDFGASKLKGLVQSRRWKQNYRRRTQYFFFCEMCGKYAAVRILCLAWSTWVSDVSLSACRKLDVG